MLMNFSSVKECWERHGKQGSERRLLPQTTKHSGQQFRHYCASSTTICLFHENLPGLHMRLLLQLGAKRPIFPATSWLLSSQRKLMSTFNLPNTSIPVHLTPDLSKDQLLSFPAFKNWINTLQHSLSTQQNEHHTFHTAPYKLRRINIQCVDFFGGNRLGFIKLKAEVSNDNGEKLPGSVFLRGGSVGMMVGVPAGGCSVTVLILKFYR